MSPLMQHIVNQLMLGNRKKSGQPELSGYRTVKLFMRFKTIAWQLVRDTFLIAAGIISAGFGLKGFLLPNNFIDGGAMGISLLITAVTGFSLPVLIILVNAPFIIMGIIQINKQFAVKTVLAVVGLSFCVAFIDYPVITSDKLLISVFGGFFLGAGIGLTVRGGGVLDGTEVLAIFTSRRTGLTIGDVILVINIIIFSFAAYLLSVEIALYSILTYLAASKTVDFIIEGIEEYTGVTIISRKNEEINKMITEKLHRGVTVYAGKKGFGKTGYQTENMDVLYTVVTRLEISRLKEEIELIDKNAFIVMHSIKDITGGMIRKRPLKN